MQIDIVAIYRPEVCRFNNPISTSTDQLLLHESWHPIICLNSDCQGHSPSFACYERSLLKYFKYWLKKMFHLNEKDKAYPW